jgi:hypothetical protein
MCKTPAHNNFAKVRTLSRAKIALALLDMEAFGWFEPAWAAPPPLGLWPCLATMSVRAWCLSYYTLASASTVFSLFITYTRKNSSCGSVSMTSRRFSTRVTVFEETAVDERDGPAAAAHEEAAAGDEGAAAADEGAAASDDREAAAGNSRSGGDSCFSLPDP